MNQYPAIDKALDLLRERLKPQLSTHHESRQPDAFQTQEFKNKYGRVMYLLRLR